MPGSKTVWMEFFAFVSSPTWHQWWRQKQPLEKTIGGWGNINLLSQYNSHREVLPIKSVECITNHYVFIIFYILIYKRLLKASWRLEKTDYEFCESVWFPRKQCKFEKAEWYMWESTAHQNKSTHFFWRFWWLYVCSFDIYWTFYWEHQ